MADIEWLDQGALVSLRRRKTATEARTYFIGQDAAHALRTWLARACIADGVVFQGLTAGGRATGLPLDPRDVRRIAKDVATRAGLSHADGVSGHSMRVGMAQDRIAADLDIAAVMQAGGWASPTMVARYTERIGASRGAVAPILPKVTDARSYVPGGDQSNPAVRTISSATSRSPSGPFGDTSLAPSRHSKSASARTSFALTSAATSWRPSPVVFHATQLPRKLNARIVAEYKPCF